MLAVYLISGADDSFPFIPSSYDFENKVNIDQINHSCISQMQSVSAGRTARMKTDCLFVVKSPLSY